ncbi:MAG: phosphodiesterase [Bacteroidales bacterium]|nr:phosphodiesterase [Bacteroidales bacterium]
MKILVFSDIHGNAIACEKVLNQYVKQNCDFILILGDILYHGPRNIITEGYNPKSVVEMLNPLSDKILACRGNCDAEVDQMLLNFPIMADYSLINDKNKTIFSSHGHIYSPYQINSKSTIVENSKFPTFNKIDIFFYGHTHIQEYRRVNGIEICNPGSISLPKGNSSSGYAICDDGNISLYKL